MRRVIRLIQGERGIPESAAILFVMNNTGGLVPRKVQDVNGRLVTRWFKADGREATATEFLLDAAGLSGAKDLTQAQGIASWDRMSEKSAVQTLVKASPGLDNPEKLWYNFDLYTNALESKHRNLALTAMDSQSVHTRLKSSWVKIHGADFDNPASYENISGDDGYDQYMEAATVLRNAQEGTVAPGMQDKRESETAAAANSVLNDLESGNNNSGLPNWSAGDKVQQADRLRDWMERSNVNEAGGTTPDQAQSDRGEATRDTSSGGYSPSDETARAANAVLDDLESDGRRAELPNWSASDTSGQADRLRDWMERSGIAREERTKNEHQSSPSERGTFTSWSSLNPFKRRKN